MKKEYFVYYGTEENAYEIEKSGAFTKEEAINFAKKNYLDEYMDKKDVEETISIFKNTDFVSVYFTDIYKGYEMYIGIAQQGKLKPIREALLELRREIVELFE